MRIVQKTMNQISDKMKIKQTVQDKLKLQSFLTDQLKDGKFKETIDTTSRYDEEFKKFLKTYQEKHKEYPHILDLSHYTRENSEFSKSNSLRQEEIDMIEEFRNRKIRNMNKPLDQVDVEDEVFEQDLQNDEENQEQNQEEQEEIEIQGNENQGYKQEEYRMSLNEDFMIILLSKGLTTKVTTLQRIQSYRYLIFMGNGNGIVGYGKGKGADFEEALDNAILHCKRNLIAIPLDLLHTVPQKLEGEYNRFKITVTPSRTFNPWGSPTLASMLLLTGFRHCRFQTVSKKINPYSMIIAYFRMITQNKTPKEICEQTGKKVYRENWGSPYFISNHPQNYL